MADEFCLKIPDFHVNSGIFYIPYIYDKGQTALLPFRRKACWGFFALGLKPRTWVPKASTLPLDHRSRYPRVIARQEEISKRKIQITPTELEPATFRILAQCLNYLNSYIRNENKCKISSYNRILRFIYFSNVLNTRYNDVNFIYSHLQDFT